MVFAAPKELIPSAMGPVPDDDVVRLIHTVSTVLPGQVRHGTTAVPRRPARPAVHRVRRERRRPVTRPGINVPNFGPQTDAWALLSWTRFS